jgi:hypothetical protein
MAENDTGSEKGRTIVRSAQCLYTHIELISCELGSGSKASVAVRLMQWLRRTLPWLEVFKTWHRPSLRSLAIVGIGIEFPDLMSEGCVPVTATPILAVSAVLEEGGSFFIGRSKHLSRLALPPCAAPPRI